MNEIGICNRIIELSRQKIVTLKITKKKHHNEIKTSAMPYEGWLANADLSELNLANYTKVVLSNEHDSMQDNNEHEDKKGTLIEN